MTTTTDLDLAHAAFERREWTAAARAFAAADRATELGAADLAMAGLAFHLIGEEDVAQSLIVRAHHAGVAAGEAPFAARMAFYLGMMSADRGDIAVAGGWISRSHRILDESGADTVERGYLLIPQAIRAVDEDPGGALALFEQAAAYATRFGEADLDAMARLGRGRSLIAMGQTERGVALLDDAMLSITSDEVGPIAVGIVYCGAIEAFTEIYDLRRAQGWTDALSRWCEAQPDLAPFRGRCLVFRADLMRFHGSWPEADVEVRRAQEWLLRPPPEPAVGEAYYLKAELHRLRGELGAAEAAYREGNTWGRQPEPGIALLRLAQGRSGSARTTIQRALDEARSDIARGPLLDALVMIAAAERDTTGTRAAADELQRLAEATGSPLLDAIATRADGIAALTADDYRAALASLRRAADLWQALDAPYELAGVRVSIAQACRALGDDDAAIIELAAARATYDRLGATPDLARLDAIAGAPAPAPGGLSTREIEVLRHLAGGGTNRQIADALGISERTVDRHVSNIYTKLDVSSRAAATAFAYEHGLV